MKADRKKKRTLLIMVSGILLIAASAAVILFSYTAQNKAEEEAKQAVTAIFDLIPEVYTGAPDGRQNTEMPVMELGGEDFAGIVEVPLYNRVLPLGSAWGKYRVTKHPCIYTGSMYDGSLVIGGSENPGQFDFMKQITGGDLITVTDMTGMRYSYLVSDVQKTKDVSYENLTSLDADLVLFARENYGTGYTLVLCNLK